MQIRIYFVRDDNSQTDSIRFKVQSELGQSSAIAYNFRLLNANAQFKERYVHVDPP
jgi:hypothetical protein